MSMCVFFETQKIFYQLIFSKMSQHYASLGQIIDMFVEMNSENDELLCALLRDIRDRLPYCAAEAMPILWDEVKSVLRV